jgi:hypothetical protein
MKGETMHELKDLVPPIDICKLIPAGEFADSVFIWGYSCDKRNTEPFIDERDCVEYCRKNIVNAPPAYPAPTTDEILSECKNIHRVLNPTLWWQGTWKADCAINKSDKLIDECLEDADFNDLAIVEVQGDKPATAALKLWLKLKGIKHE